MNDTHPTSGHGNPTPLSLSISTSLISSKNVNAQRLLMPTPDRITTKRRGLSPLNHEHALLQSAMHRPLTESRKARLGLCRRRDESKTQQLIRHLLPTEGKHLSCADHADNVKAKPRMPHNLLLTEKGASNGDARPSTVVRHRPLTLLCIHIQHSSLLLWGAVCGPGLSGTQQLCSFTLFIMYKPLSSLRSQPARISYPSGYARRHAARHVV